MGKKEVGAARRQQVRELFLSLPKEQRRGGENAVLKFYVWVREHRPELLSHHRCADPYLDLMSELTDLCENF